jgi:hypothetical protein
VLLVVATPAVQVGIVHRWIFRCFLVCLSILLSKLQAECQLLG